MMASICRRTSSVNNLALPVKHLRNGPKKAKLDSSLLPVNGISIIPTTLPNSLESKTPKSSTRKRKKLSTPESRPRPKKQICNDKSKYSNPPTQTIPSSQTSQAGSTLNDAACVPFWKNSTTNLSNRSWSCTKTDSVELDSIFLNSSVKKLTANSWFTTKFHRPINQTIDQKIMNENWQKIYSPWLMSLSQKTTEEEHKKIEKREKKWKANPKNANKKLPNQNIRAKKIKLLPTPNQKTILKQWFGTARFLRNQCLRATNEEKLPTTVKSVREFVKTLQSKYPWLEETPYEIRDHAVTQFVQDVHTQIKLIRSGIIHHFKMKFKSKKEEGSIQLRVRGWNSKKQTLYGWKQGPLKTSEPCTRPLVCDSKIWKNQKSDFYLVEAYESSIQIRSVSESQAYPRVIALDPGIRTFVTGYDPGACQVIEWGKDDIKRIGRLCWSYDKLFSKAYSKNPNTANKRGELIRAKCRYRMKKALGRLRCRIRNLVDEMHRKLAKWLCENYDIILFPHFNSRQMVKKVNRKIHSKTARAMMTWSHCRFENYLRSKAQLYRGSSESKTSVISMVNVNESFTSKTCGQCGRLKEDLGGSKNFKCRYCGLEMDRDFNGARNIWLRCISKLSELAINAVSLETIAACGQASSHTEQSSEACMSGDITNH